MDEDEFPSACIFQLRHCLLLLLLVRCAAEAA